LLASPFVIDSKIGVFNKIGAEAPFKIGPVNGREGQKRTSAEGIDCATSGGMSSVMFRFHFVSLAGFSSRLAGKSKTPHPIS
jgi:hypothetical protein